MYRFVLLSVFSALFVLSAAQSPQCFYPDGVTIEPNHVPCNSTLSSSACCDPLDSCTTSGLCLGSTGFNYRGSCTDSSWLSGNCPAVCHSDPFTNFNYSTSTALWPCDKLGGFSSNFCCESSSKDCCTTTTFNYGTTGIAFKAGFDTILAELSNANTSESSATAIATVTTTIVAGQATSSSNAVRDSNSKNLGPTVGAAVAVPLSLLAVGLLVFLFWRERRRSRAEIIVETNPNKGSLYESRRPVTMTHISPLERHATVAFQQNKTSICGVRREAHEML